MMTRRKSNRVPALIFMHGSLLYEILSSSFKLAVWAVPALLLILLNGIMFLCIHFPIWIHSGMFISAFTGLGFLSIILFSVAASICFLKHKNLMLVVFIHMLYDFILEFFVIT